MGAYTTKELEHPLVDEMELLVLLARDVVTRGPVRRAARVGELAVEVSGLGGVLDPDSVGWVIGVGEAPYGPASPKMGPMPTRHVWDIIPLNPRAKLNTDGVQRWENAEFRALPISEISRELRITQ